MVAHAPILSIRCSLTNLLIQKRMKPNLLIQQRLMRFEKVFQMMNDVHCTQILNSKSYIFCPFWIDTHLFCNRQRMDTIRLVFASNFQVIKRVEESQNLRLNILVKNQTRIRNRGMIVINISNNYFLTKMYKIL